MVCRAAGNSLADQLARHCLGLVLCLCFICGNVHGLLVGKLLVQLRQKQLLGVFRGKAGNGLQLFHFTQAKLLHLVQPGLGQLLALAEVFLLLLHRGNLFIQRFFLLVQPALLAGQLVAAFLYLLVGLRFHLEGGVLRLHKGFLAFLLRRFHGVVHKPSGFFFRAAYFCLSHLFAVAFAQKKAHYAPGGQYGHDPNDHQPQRQ